MSYDDGGDDDALAELRWQSALLLLWMQPTSESEARRTNAANYVRSLIQQQPELAGARVLDTGSFASKTYLPDSDVDLTITLPCSSYPGAYSDDWMLAVNHALCRAAIGLPPGSNSNGRSGAARNDAAQDTSSSRESSSSVSSDGSPISADKDAMHPLPIRNVTFVCARVKLVSCVVGNLTVDVACGKPSTGAAALLLNEADRCLDQHLAACHHTTHGYEPCRPLDRKGGISSDRSVFLPALPSRHLPSLPVHAQTHLFKRSLLLVKAWCFYESSALVRAATGEDAPPVLGSKRGRLSSSALSVMLLSLFNETAAERYAYLESLHAQASFPLHSPPCGPSNCGRHEDNVDSSDISSDSGFPAKVRNYKISSSSSSGGVHQSHRRSSEHKQAAEQDSSAAQTTYAAQQQQQWELQQQRWLARAALACGAELRDPLAVLLRFLRVFAVFNWDLYALTVDGPVPLDSRNSTPASSTSGSSSSQASSASTSKIGKSNRSSNSTKTTNDGNNSNDNHNSAAEVRPLTDVLANVRSAIKLGTASNGARIRGRGEMSSSSRSSSSSAYPNSSACIPAGLADGFPIRPGMHIVDPLNPCNNLAAGVGRAGARAVTLALELGRQQLEGSVATYLHQHRNHLRLNQRSRRNASLSSSSQTVANLPGRIRDITAADTSMSANSVDYGSSRRARTNSGSTSTSEGSSKTTHSSLTDDSSSMPNSALHGSGDEVADGKDADLTFLTWTFPAALALYGPAPPLYRRPVLHVPATSIRVEQKRSSAGGSNPQDDCSSSSTRSKDHDTTIRLDDPKSPGELALRPLGNALFKLIAAMQPPILPPLLVGKVTGMLLENPAPAVEALMKNSIELESTVKEALTVLTEANYTAGSDASQMGRIPGGNGEVMEAAKTSWLSVVTGSGHRYDLLDHPMQTHMIRSRAPSFSILSTASNDDLSAGGSLSPSYTNKRVFGEHGYDLEGYYLAADSEALRAEVASFVEASHCPEDAAQTDHTATEGKTGNTARNSMPTNYTAERASQDSTPQPKESSEEDSSGNYDEEETSTETEEDDESEEGVDSAQTDWHKKSSSLDRSHHEIDNGQTKWRTCGNWLESLAPWMLFERGKQQPLSSGIAPAVATADHKNSNVHGRRNSGNRRHGKHGGSNKAPSSVASASTNLLVGGVRGSWFQRLRLRILRGRLVLASCVFVIFGACVYYTFLCDLASELGASPLLPPSNVSGNVQEPLVRGKKNLKSSKPKTTEAASKNTKRASPPSSTNSDMDSKAGASSAKTSNQRYSQTSSIADRRATASTCDGSKSNHDDAMCTPEEADSASLKLENMIGLTKNQQLSFKSMQVTVLGSSNSNVAGASQGQPTAEPAVAAAAAAATAAAVDTAAPALEVRFVPLGADAVLGDFTAAAAMRNSEDVTAKQKKRKKKEVAAVSVAWEYQWHKNGVMLLDSTSQPFYTISAASAASEGNYSCYARPKHVASRPPSSNVAAAMPGAPRPPDASRRAVETVPPQGSASAIDSSIAKLVLDTAPFTLISAVALRVASAPQVDLGLQTHTLSVGQPLRLEATGARGAPPPACVWLFQNLPLDYYTEPGGGGRFSANHGTSMLVGSQGAEGAVLVVDAVDGRHAGTYTCRCANVLGVAVWEEGFVTVAEESLQTWS